MRPCVVLFAALGALASWASVGESSSVEKQIGPQTFAEKSVESAGATDSLIAMAVECAVASARNHQFWYDASGSAEGRVVVKALWKGDPVVLTMRFYRKDSVSYIASKLEQTATTLMNKGGEKIENLYYGELAVQTKQRGIQLRSGPEIGDTEHPGEPDSLRTFTGIVMANHLGMYSKMAGPTGFGDTLLVTRDGLDYRGKHGLSIPAAALRAVRRSKFWVMVEYDLDGKTSQVWFGYGLYNNSSLTDEIERSIGSLLRRP
jgi:hypothetical protein